jgi:sugar/nucleoside kinase (ribokinase family)
VGGSAVYFSMAASFFCPVRFVGVVGADCPFDLAEVFAGRDVDLAGLEIRQTSKTFRWTGKYHDDMDNRTTECLELNVLAEAPPKVPQAFRDSSFVFLANTAPRLQYELLGQIDRPVFVAADTMNCWIEGHLTDLKTLLGRIDCLIINEDEARMLAADHNLVKAAARILNMGPSVVVIKKGESGSLVRTKGGEIFVLPAYPTEQVIDPTGAGDSFAGALLGYAASVSGNAKPDFQTIKMAVAYGTVVASFTIGDFSVKGLSSATKFDMGKRLKTLQKLTKF